MYIYIYVPVSSKSLKLITHKNKFFEADCLKDIFWKDFIIHSNY